MRLTGPARDNIFDSNRNVEESDVLNKKRGGIFLLKGGSDSNGSIGNHSVDQNHRSNRLAIAANPTSLFDQYLSVSYREELTPPTMTKP